MSNYNLQQDIAGLGRNLRVIGILLLLGFIPLIGGIFSLISFFITLSALAKVNRLRHQLNDDNLYKARKYYIYSYVLLFVSIFAMAIIMVMVAISYNLDLMLLTPLIAIITFVPIAIASIIEYKAWSYFKGFFDTNPAKLPEGIKNDALNGCDKIRTSIILNILLTMGVMVVLIILFSVLISWAWSPIDIINTMQIPTTIMSYIGIIISIYRAIGYFKLGHLSNITPQGYGYSPQPPTQYQYQPQPTPYTATPSQNTPQPSSQQSYCPFCGTKIQLNARFCPNCGGNIQD